MAAAVPLTGDPVVSRVLAAHNARLQGDRAGISGDDLLDLGLARGPAVGAVLDQLRDARLDGLVTDAGRGTDSGEEIGFAGLGPWTPAQLGTDRRINRGMR